jgi:hypothetical protein
VESEAAKLFEAVQGWARSSGLGHADATASAAGGVASTWSMLNEHVATGGADCRYCPLCRAIAAARATSPEARQHLASAAASLVQALASSLATTVPSPEPQPEGPVKRAESSRHEASDGDVDSDEKREDG